jgi:adenosine deaminase
MRRCAIVLFLLLIPSGYAQHTKSAEQRTADYLESIRNQPLLLSAFVEQMPKGGDLHNHLTGAVYAESYIQFAAEDGLCVDRPTLTFTQPPCDESKKQVSATKALEDAALYRDLIDGMSMRDFKPAAQSGHDHFFDTFGKFRIPGRTHTAEMIAEVVSRAGRQNESYLELTMSVDRGAAGPVGAKIGWDEDFAALREKLLAGGLREVIATAVKSIDAVDAQSKSLMCNGARKMAGSPPQQANTGLPPQRPQNRRSLGTPGPVGGPGSLPQQSKSGIAGDPGCGLEVRYIYEVYRGFPKEQVFAQALTGFEMAMADPRIVAVNPVMPEDGYVSMHDYELHMRIFDFLHKTYPKVHLTLHAGELAPGLVPPDGLTFHIRQAIELGHAERIGHGVDVMHEDRPFDLLKQMTQKKIAVEICLTSNDMILGIRGREHPLPQYLNYKVPVVIATDDEGVSRSDMSREYQRVVEGYGLNWGQLKQIVRNSIQYSFVDEQTKSGLMKDLEQRFAKFEIQF